LQLNQIPCRFLTDSLQLNRFPCCSISFIAYKDNSKKAGR
jgi:hypothetical protein